MSNLIDLEEQGWQALSSGREIGQGFYNSVLHENAIMLFPEGLRIEGKEKILQSLAAQPWQSYEMEDTRQIPLCDTAAAVLYRVTAQRAGQETYHALISSTYIREDGAWKLILHQQTPYSSS